ncbi:hypothetical protein Pint_15488 [Pistacia integerrima]|uniref:Uncharacterized protein n=2 Tax=Pistacia TaxID=55512 RepID=A0ACC1BZJ3_9ROSI|nr:hypothetical protein Pint_15488 [Pistacia integerrima]KAJ0105310.1 hypothetical protein Patl1_18073 [Pistacia atlantica]
MGYGCSCPTKAAAALSVACSLVMSKDVGA